jgi:hypothetical protein
MVTDFGDRRLGLLPTDKPGAAFCLFRNVCRAVGLREPSKTCLDLSAAHLY